MKLRGPLRSGRVAMGPVEESLAIATVHRLDNTSTISVRPLIEGVGNNNLGLPL